MFFRFKMEWSKTKCLISIIVLIILSTCFIGYILQMQEIIFATTLASGLLINLGTIIQCIKISKGNNQLNEDYMISLISGCWILFICQLWSSLFNNPLLSFDMYITCATSLLSALINSIMIFIKHVKGNRKETNIKFLEGVPAIGKTTVSDVSFDFLHFLKYFPEYIEKSHKISVNCIYNLHLYSSIMNFLIKNNKSRVIDREYLSQVCFSLLHELDGTVRDYEEFREDVVNHIKKYSNEIVFCFKEHERLLDNLFPNNNFSTDVYILPEDEDEQNKVLEFLVNNIKRRGTFENNFISIERYLINTSGGR